jgi:leucyl-tRNA synthetase
MVLGEDSQKMSKRWGNVVALDDLVQTYGADTLRAYLMFFARWDQGGPWSSTGIEGTNRWIKRLWNLFSEPGESKKVEESHLRDLRRKVHQTLKAVTSDFESFEFNTIISALMELSNEMIKIKNEGAQGSPEWDEAVDIYLRMLAPVAPHISEEIWQKLGKPYSIHTQSWPVVDEEAAREEEIVLVVQINSKLRDRITVPASIIETEAKEKALASPVIQKFLEGKKPRQIIYVPGRLINIVL